MFKKPLSAVTCITLAARAATQRAGREHVYMLNGSRLRDLLIDGRWLTVSVTDPVSPRVGA